MSTVTGVVESISINAGKSPKGKAWTKYGFKVDGEWYSGFRSAENAAQLDAVNEGSTVQIEFTINGQWKNLDSITVTSESVAPVAAPGSSVAVTGRDNQYVYTARWAIATAADLVKTGMEQGHLKYTSKKPFDEAVAAVLMIGEKLAAAAWTATPPAEEESFPEDDSEGQRE